MPIVAGLQVTGLPGGVVPPAAPPRLVLALVAVTRLNVNSETPENPMIECSCQTKKVQTGAVFDLVVQFLDDAGLPRDISGATYLKIRLASPDGSAVEFSGGDVALDSDGLDGLAKHLTIAADTEDAGLYKAQGFAMLGTLPIKTFVGQFWAREDAPAPEV